MKRLGRVMGNLFAMALAVVTMQVMAETQLGGRDFNHMTTGFPLTGVHATTACETCHVGGVFKGTPKNCDGCHALGKRVVATPKSTSHIVTDAPCETCHFNTFTFLGARYNHGSAVPGQCTNCHNGRQAAGKPASHAAGKKATDSCDHCHRSFAWTPASWNHTGVVPGSCDSAGCHVMGSNQYYRSSTTHTRTGMATLACDDCHNYVSWSPARYRHNTAALCSSCHNGVYAVGKYAGHFATTDECNQCHTSTLAWLPALGAKPANHIPYTAGTLCSSCHVGGTVVTGPTLHAYLTGQACTTCHLSGASYYWPSRAPHQKSVGHEGMRAGDDCSKSGCHRPLGSRGTAYVKW